ncbi:MAG: 2-oxoacid:acceptor oxidoreductase family protein, partial [Albidovulum sp.]
MTLHDMPAGATADPRLDGIIKLAILAVGGQGGGVLTGWIEDLARANGYAAQATSVAGVAQRTGATVYYIEMAPHRSGDPVPVFSLMPAAGDVDIMITAEMMEAGRSILRGFVTPDRTTLITSTHRALAVSEKMVPGDGIASSEEVMAAAEVAARRFIAADFDRLAIANGSVISASLFGALAGAEVLPFPREAFEAAISAGGKGVEGSL